MKEFKSDCLFDLLFLIQHLHLDKLRDGAPSSGASGSGGPVFGVPLSQCVEAAPWRKRSACTSTSTTGMDIPEITSPTVSKASRSDSRISVGSSISVQDRVNLLLPFINVEH